MPICISMYMHMEVMGMFQIHTEEQSDPLTRYGVNIVLVYGAGVFVATCLFI